MCIRDRFYPVQLRRNAARLYELDAMDSMLELQLRGALDEIQSALGGVPVIASPIVDYYELPLENCNNRWLLPFSTPAVDSHPTIGISSPAVHYMDANGHEITIPPELAFVDWHHELPIFNVQIPADISDERTSRPIWTTYTGGYELLENRDDAI